jgi:hypothetical protein
MAVAQMTFAHLLEICNRAAEQSPVPMAWLLHGRRYILTQINVFKIVGRQKSVDKALSC